LKYVPTIPPLDHSEIVYEDFEKNFYRIHPDLTKLTYEDIKQARKKLRSLSLSPFFSLSFSFSFFLSLSFSFAFHFSFSFSFSFSLYLSFVDFSPPIILLISSSLRD